MFTHIQSIRLFDVIVIHLKFDPAYIKNNYMESNIFYHHPNASASATAAHVVAPPLQVGPNYFISFVR